MQSQQRAKNAKQSGLKNQNFAQTLICKESKAKSECDFILPGKFVVSSLSSPRKMLPKKPVGFIDTTPDLLMIERNGETTNIADKQRLLMPSEVCSKQRLIEKIGTDLSLPSNEAVH